MWPVTDDLSLPPIAPSQTLPDLLHQDPLKFSPRSVSRLDEEDEDWDRTLRPNLGDQPPPALGASSARSIAHSRESSLEKLSRGPPPTANSTLTSPRLHTGPLVRGGLGAVTERLVDPKSVSYGHHRQTSIVHGIQHSRNGSLASSSSSPLSPQMIAAAGASLLSDPLAAARLEADVPLPSRPTTALSGSTVATSTPHVPERTSSAAPDAAAHPPAPRKLERMHSGRSRRDHAHHPSHSSRHHKDEQKTVGEYALHVLFTSVRLSLHDCSRQDSLTLTLRLVHCPGRREAERLHYRSIRPRATDRANMRARCRPAVRSIDRGAGPHCEPEAKAPDRLDDALEEKQKRCGQRCTESAAAVEGQSSRRPAPAAEHGASGANDHPRGLR